MLLFGHLGVTLGIFFSTCLFVPQLRAIIDPKYLLVEVLLPDIIEPIPKTQNYVSGSRILNRWFWDSLYIINFKLKPRLDDLKLRIKELKSNFKYNALKNVLGAGIAISTQYVGINVQATAFAGFVGKMLIDYSNYHNSYKHILSDSKNRGLSLLLHLNKEYCK